MAAAIVADEAVCVIDMGQAAGALFMLVQH